MAVGLSYEDPAVKLLNDGANIKVVYPKKLPAELLSKSEKYGKCQEIYRFIISKHKIREYNHY